MQKEYQFDPVTLKKIGVGALIAGSGAILTYLAENITTLDFGVYTPLATAILAILVNTVREYIKGVE